MEFDMESNMESNMEGVYVYIYILLEHEWHMKSGMEDDAGILIYQSMEVSEVMGVPPGSHPSHG